jgi:hypothetical protein
MSTVPAPHALDTRAAPRRAISFSSADDLLREIDRVEQATLAGRTRTTGNWTPAQMMWHVAEFWRCSFDGFGFKAPLAMRAAVAPFKRMILAKPKAPAGIKFRGGMRRFAPPAHVTIEQGAGALRAQIARVQRGERMTRPSPLFGRLDHDAWLRMHLAHAAHHLSFVEPG